MNNNDLTILMVSTDSYSDLWNGFFSCKERFWNNCPYKTVLATDTKKYERDGVDVITIGKYSNWSVRTRVALNQIKSKYVCFLLEDFYITDYVNSDSLQDAVSFMSSRKLRYYKLLSLSKFHTLRFEGKNYLNCIPGSYPYGISLMAAIWEKDFFLEKIGSGDYNPWRFEVDRLNEERQCEHSDELVGVYDSRNILNITHMVVQGKYLPKSFQKVKSIDSTLISPDRSVMTFIEYMLHSIKVYINLLKRRYSWIRVLLTPFNKFSIAEKNS